MSYQDYINQDRIPHTWCSGCGHGLVLSSLARACDELQLDTHKSAFVSGIGCWSRADSFLNFNAMHATHGRAVSFATGIKIARPELTVVACTGDGCSVTIGGNHFIHAARRNIDMTVIISNNYNYGTTGGQYSSTTPTGSITATSALGHIERPMDICALAAAAGATYVARGVCDDVLQNAKLIADGIRHKGFSVVEVLSPCPTQYGRKNKMPRMSECIKWMHDQTYRTNSTVASVDGKLPIGKLVELEGVEDYGTSYAKIIELAQGGVNE